MGQKPDLSGAYNETEGKGVLVRTKTASGAQAASRIAVPWGFQQSAGQRSEQPDLTVKLVLHLSRLSWRSLEVPSNLYHSTGCHMN